MHSPRNRLTCWRGLLAGLVRAGILKNRPVTIPITIHCFSVELSSSLINNTNSTNFMIYNIWRETFP